VTAECVLKLFQHLVFAVSDRWPANDGALNHLPHLSEGYVPLAIAAGAKRVLVEAQGRDAEGAKAAQADGEEAAHAKARAEVEKEENQPRVGFQAACSLGWTHRFLITIPQATTLIILT
jgi:hypothetical protein